MSQTPTVARNVHYQPHKNDDKPLPAIIVEVHENEECTLAIFDPVDRGVRFEKVPHAAGDVPTDGYWHWPPYVAPSPG